MLQVENTLFTITMLCYFAAMILYFAFIAVKKDGVAKVAVALQIAGFALHAPVIFLIIGYAAMQSKDVKALMPALRSNWLGFHVSTAIIAYGAFGVSFVLSIIFLVRDRLKDDGFLARHIPTREVLDMISYRSVSLGLLFLTFTIITGAIWAERAWGSYWSWDPKETWSLVTWIIYATYLHLRLRRGWQGRAAAVFAVVGFVCVLFTYLGVNTFLPGIHSYA